jgi:protein-tyrosine phosphatase
MDQILPYSLWLGHAGDGRDYSRLCELDIKVLVQLAAEEPPLLPPRAITYLRFPLVDGAGNQGELLTIAISTITTLISLRIPTLICCGVGLSRSPAIAAGAISWTSGEAPEQSLIRIIQHRHADVSPGLWDAVRGVLASRDIRPTLKRVN